MTEYRNLREEAIRESNERFKRIEKHMEHITKLTGISFYRIEELDEYIDGAGKALAKKKR